jgi:dynein intermediate chain 2
VCTVVCWDARQVEELIKQNNAIDIYEEYFNSGEVVDHSSEQPYTKTLTVFRDPQASKMGEQTRSAPYLSWHPDGGRKLCVSYSILDFQKQPKDMPLSSYVWDVNNPNTPETEMTPGSQMVCGVFNPKDPNVIVSGLYNGQVRFPMHFASNRCYSACRALQRRFRRARSCRS